MTLWVFTPLCGKVVVTADLGGKLAVLVQCHQGLVVVCFLERVHHPFSLSTDVAKKACIGSEDAVQIFACVLATVFWTGVEEL